MELRICLQCQELVPLGRTRCGHCDGPVGLADAWAMLGRRLGRYRLARLVGVGGMGVVYAAEHTGLGRQVALKLLLPSLQGEAYVERFRREARVLAALSHPHIVDVLDFDITPGGVPYYAMELLDGCSLAALLARRGALTPAQLAPLLRQVGAALEHAHAQQVVHRDLKPDNIFLARQGGSLQAKLLDFGIAKRVGADAIEDPRLTGTGAVIGTPMYLTPEQAVGGQVDARTDQYALALIVGECLAGRPLRIGMSLTEIVWHAQHHPLDPEALPQTLPAAARAALVRATQPDPALRHASVGAFIDALGFGADAQIDPALLPGHPAAPAALAVTTPAGALPETERILRPGSTQQAGAPATPGPAARVRTRPGPMAAVLLMVLGVIGLAAWWARAPREGASPARAPEPLRELASLPTPGDAGRLLGISSAGAVFATAGGVWLMPLDPARTSTRRADPQGEGLIGVGEQGEWWLRRGDRLYAIDPAGTGERELLAWPAGASGVHALRRDGRALAWAEASGVRLAQAGNAPARTLASVDGARVAALELGDRALLALLRDPLEIRVQALAGDEAAWSARTAVGRVHQLAWDEPGDQVAVCGFAPEVEVHARAGAAPRRIPVSGACHAAMWLPGGRQLVLRDDRGLRWWDADSGEGAHLELAGGGHGARFAWSGGQLWLADPGSGTLRRHALGAPAPAPANPEGGAEAWDLLQFEGAQFVAHADGTLLRLSDGIASRQRVHEAGITDLVGAAGQLASASDDRSLAAWRAADLTVTWRTRGHDFLVNQLWLSADGSALWSSSSDGSLKRWRWPALEVEETIDLRALGHDPALSLHALWLDADQREALVGSWNHALLRLRRDPQGAWNAQRLEVASAGGYRLLELAEAECVLLLGTQPTRVYAWDRRAERLLALPDFGLELYALTAGSDPGRALAAGVGALLEYQLRRAAEGGLQLRWRVRPWSSLGTIGAADADPAGRRWWLADNEGRVRAVGFDDLPPAADRWTGLR